MSLSSLREWKRKPLTRKDVYLALLVLAVVAILPFAGSALNSAGNTTYYVDFDNGSDSNDGISAATPWKHAPGDSNATSTASMVLAPGDTVLFKGGVHYRGSITINASGSSGSPITYKGDGWGSGKAIIDGSEPVTGWTACADAASCGNNSNWSHIYHATIPSIPSYLTSTPEIRLNVIQDGLPIITAQIPESTSRYYQETSTYYSVAPSNVTSTTITDSRLATLGGANLVGSYVYIWRSPNDVSFVKISAFDSGTNTITFPTTSVYTNKNTLYAIANYMGDTVFNREGQYYFNPVANGGGTYDLYVWPLGNIDLTTTGEITTSVRSVGININAKDYVTIEGFYIERQNGDSNGEGSAIYQSNSSRSTDLLVTNNEVALGNGVSGGSINFQWVDSSTISNNYVHDTLGNMRGIQAGGATQLTISGNQVRNISRTGIYFGDVDNSEISGNTVTDIFSSHGNGITVYQGSDTINVFNNIIRNSNVDYTMESSSNIHTYNNLIDGYNATGNVVADWGGMSGANTFINNTIINSNNNTSMYIAGGGSSSWIIENNIIDGGGRTTYVGAGVTFANNIYTGLAWNQSSRYGWSLASGESVVTNQDTIFVSPGSNDYRLSSTSPAIDAGIDASAYTNEDILGTNRPQGANFDIGAYEYVTGGSGDTTAPSITGGSPTGVLSSGTTGTTISVTTDETATCYYATSGGLAYTSMTTFGSTGNTSHSTSVSGLSDGGSYTYYVKCRDSLGNTSTVDYTVAFSVGSDINPPVISSVVIGNVTTTSARITWTTNESADTQVEYGDVIDDYPDQTTLDSTPATSHTATITGLTANTTYFFRALSRDPAGNLQNSTAYSFTTLATLDTTAPVISSLATSTSATTATISWSTDEIAAPYVSYGPTSSYGSASSTANYSTASSIILSGLTPLTTYHYQITATDPSDNIATTSDATFTTITDTTPPSLSSIASTPSSASAVITWTTNESADSQINYGLSTSYGSSSTLDSTLVTSHSVTLGSLATSTTYHYQIRSADAVGNIATSSDQVFVTTDVVVTTTPPDTDDRANAGHNPTTIIPKAIVPTPEPDVVVAVTPTATVVLPTLESIFKRDLTVGDTGVDVLTLQKILLMRQYLETGYDTGYFGERTKQALIAFQKFTGITPATGYFGPKTIAMVIGKALPQLPVETPTTPPVVPVPPPVTPPVVAPVAVVPPPVEVIVPPAPIFIPPVVEIVPAEDPSLVSELRRVLSIGSQGVDVAILQQVLKSQGYYAYPISGFYDSNTALATADYQKTHGITTEPGFVGPLTRSLINARK